MQPTHGYGRPTDEQLLLIGRLVGEAIKLEELGRLDPKLVRRLEIRGLGCMSEQDATELLTDLRILLGVN